MFRMQTLYEMKNPSYMDSEKTGVEVSAVVRAVGTPSMFELALTNGYHKALFLWDYRGILAGASSMVGGKKEDEEGSSESVWEGQLNKVEALPPYEKAEVHLSIRGTTLRSRVKNGVDQAIAVYKVVDPLKYQVETGWKVSVRSVGHRQESGVTIQQLCVLGEGDFEGDLITEFFTLTEQDILNKYVTLRMEPSLGVAVNVAQAVTQREGEDFKVGGNILMWQGMGLDVKQMKPGVVLRVTYYTEAVGKPSYEMFQKTLVSINK